MATVTTNLGTITAYGEAVNGGYTGSKSDFQTAMNNYAEGITNASEALAQATINATSIGTLSNLDTTAKTNLVSAINEVDADVTALNADIIANCHNHNLMGMEVGKYYPVTIPQGTKLTIRRSDGTVFASDNVERINVYDANKNYVTYYGLNTGVAYKTTAEMPTDIGYLRWYDTNGGTYETPMMVTTYENRNVAYEEYFADVHVLARLLDALTDRVSALEG